MIRVVDITFHTNSEYADTTALLKAQRASLFYIDAVQHKVDIHVVKHVSATTKITGKENFHFFTGKNKPGYISAGALQLLKNTKPDVVIVHGLRVPLQILRLKWVLGRKTRIIAVHHAEKSLGWPKKILYKAADLCIDNYFFTSNGNAGEWLDAGIIGNSKKITEQPPTLSIFCRQDKILSKNKLKMNDGLHYLWVGRLDSVKDPLSVLEAFQQFIKKQPLAKLHIVYLPGKLFPAVCDFLEQQPRLKNNIFLHGYVPNEELATWYSAADFFISSSLREAGSVTILEAMACGCIPVVTAIPASLKVTGDGTLGLQYQAGNVDGLVEALTRSVSLAIEEQATLVENHFKKEYSVDAVANRLVALFESIVRK